MKAQVLLPKLFNFSFTYKTKKEKLTPGDIVEVPFGKEKVIGVVWPSESFAPKDIPFFKTTHVLYKNTGKVFIGQVFFFLEKIKVPHLSYIAFVVFLTILLMTAMRIKQNFLQKNFKKFLMI